MQELLIRKNVTVPRYKFIKGDICNRINRIIFSEYDISGVIHFAAEFYVS